MTVSKITYDGSLDVATGKDRFEKNWKNQQMLWSDLVKELSETHRTHETYAAYMALSGVKGKKRQDEIKDVGGFVGGLLANGKRGKQSVVHRSMLTLDIDHGTGDIWADFQMMYDNAACIYSTHKHSKENPRLRLIIPLNRTVTPGEYEAIARRIAGNMDIERFDSTTYQSERLMYFPSTSKDGEFAFEYQDGAWLDADQVLRTYHDWRDISEWPMSTAERKKPLKGIAKLKQEDPESKNNIVGAFCRTHDAHDAIEQFLSDVYEKCNSDRYTFIGGTTSGGLVIYEDKWGYSNHSTDPANDGHVHNAFDLVRIHKFGLLDEGKDGETASFQAMCEFAKADPATSKTLSVERLEVAMQDFAEDLEEPDQEPASDDWLSTLEKDKKKGEALSTIDNVVKILQNDPKLKGRLAYNQFEDREVALKSLPWHKKNFKPGPLADSDDAGLRHYIERAYGISGEKKISDALCIVVRENGFHPVRDYLNSLEWDGQERLDTLLIDYLGAKDNLYTRTVTRKAFVAAVYRVFNPGIKFDNMLTIVGPQGIGKSTIIHKMGGKWFSDSFNFNMLNAKNHAEEQLRGAWLVEVGELTGLSKADVNSAKSFLSRTEDRYRVSYGKRIDFFPRQAVFFGSTNNPKPLRDASGNRRFWIVVSNVAEATKDVFNDLSQQVIDQIWAEARYLQKKGEVLYLSAEVKKMAEQVQEEHTDTDDREGMIQKYLDMLLPADWYKWDQWKRRDWLTKDDEVRDLGINERTHVCAAEIWCEIMGGTIKDMNRTNTKVIHDVLQKTEGWTGGNKHKRMGYCGIQRVYERVNKKKIVFTKNVNDVNENVNKN